MRCNSHPVCSPSCRNSSAAAPDASAEFGSYDNGGGGAAWWQEWEPSAAEARQQQQQQAPQKSRPWQPPADSDAQVLAALTTKVRDACGGRHLAVANQKILQSQRRLI